LFPQTYITVIYWFFFIGTFEVPALYFILFKLIIYDNLIDRLYYENIAYEAHLAGYAFGIALVFVFLLTKLVSSSGYDLLDMAKQWNRRRRFRDIVASGYDPFAGSIKKVKANSKEAAPKVTADTRIADLRGQISEQIAKQTIAEAARLYLELMGLDKEQLLPQKQLLDIANQLAGQGQYREAAYAYDQFISHYNSYEYIGQVQLMLGLIYSRYLNEPELAVKVLQIAEKGLGDPAQLQMCKDEIEKLKNPDR